MMNFRNKFHRSFPCLSRYPILYDEERPTWGSSFHFRWRKNRLTFSGSRRVAAYLLLFDLILIGLLLHYLKPLISLLQRNQELFGHHVSLPHHGETSDFHRPAQQTIPRILHQTCASEVIPKVWVSSQQSCREAYADSEYQLWTDELACEFLESVFPWFVSTWDDYVFPIQRADAIQYLTLYCYSGIYIDMDTICNNTFPIHQIQPRTTKDYALFKSTSPTGITNDFIISTAQHPAFKEAILRLPGFHDRTRLWARLQPYVAIMMSTGPLFITLAVKEYLLSQPFLPSLSIQFMNSSQLTPYITDLETASWHGGDAQVLMWLGDKPWAWYSLGILGLVVGVYTVNCVLMRVFIDPHRKGSSTCL